ncbi:uncharacterized protein LOC130897442 [Diorhabda carinulata]|uniref:uncharacterized protein LOC130897442 n=1 Tax=Diorhabda carinulata TaxID=1163345 RepID=UPI0025A1F0C3|nr:uncharacterized protein LOC130897442 [Diorhabda carinulata]
MSDADALVAAATAIFMSALVDQHVHRSTRRFWSRPSLVNGRKKYSTTEFIKDLLLDEVDPLNLEYRRNAGFKNFFRMKSSDIETLLGMIGLIISKKNTTFRKAIPPSERFAVTMRFLASGDSYSSLSYLLKMSKQTISSIIPDVCAALISVLQDEVKKPENASDWNIIAKQFHDLWQYPNCIGAIDGKHLTLQAPIHSGSEFFNYKSFHSIVLLAIVDASYNFIYANIGCQRRISDGGVFNNTSFKEQLDTNALHLPPPCPLPGRQLPMQYCLVGDEAFQLTVNLMKPFSGTYARGYKERIFNYRLSRACRVSENAFGILSSSFRVLRKPMLLEPAQQLK